MTDKKVIGLTLSNPADIANLNQFKQLFGIDGDAEAARAIIQRYFSLSYKEREALENKLRWKLHRNKGFRSLAHFAKDLPKRKAKVHVLPDAQGTREAAKSTQENLDF